MSSTVGDPFIGFGVCINSIPEHYAALTLPSIPLPASTIAIQDLRMPRPALPFCPCYHFGDVANMIKSAVRLFRHRIFYICSFMPLSSVTHLSSPASCSGVTVVSRHASQFVYTRPASLRIMLAAYCPNDPSGAGKTMAPPLPHAALGAYPAQRRPDGKGGRRKT